MKKPVIYTVDWPWQFNDDLPGPGRGAASHYPTMATADKRRPMSMAEAEDFVLPATLDGRTRPSPSVLFMWRVKDLQQEALRLMLMWGYSLKSELCWVKKTVHGKDHMGMGRIVRQSHEICLVGVRGRVPEVGDHGVRSVFTTEEELASPLYPMDTSFEAAVGRHSEKPDVFYDIVRRLYPDAAEYHDVFARIRRPGWIPFGNQLPEEVTNQELADHLEANPGVLEKALRDGAAYSPEFFAQLDAGVELGEARLRARSAIERVAAEAEAAVAIDLGISLSQEPRLACAAHQVGDVDPDTGEELTEWDIQLRETIARGPARTLVSPAPEPSEIHVRGADALVIMCSCGHEDPEHNWAGVCQRCDCEGFRPCHGQGFRNGHCKHAEPAVADPG